MFLRTGATIEPSKLGLAARKAAFHGNKAAVVFAAHAREHVRVLPLRRARGSWDLVLRAVHDAIACGRAVMVTCNTVAECAKRAAALRLVLPAQSVALCHSGGSSRRVTAAERNEMAAALSAWSSGLPGCPVVLVGTSVVHRGIHNPKCGLAVMWDTPESCAAAGQIAGRIGRDLRPSVALVFVCEDSMARNISLRQHGLTSPSLRADVVTAQVAVCRLLMDGSRCPAEALAAHFGCAPSGGRHLHSVRCLPRHLWAHLVRRRCSRAVTDCQHGRAVGGAASPASGPVGHCNGQARRPARPPRPRTAASVSSATRVPHLCRGHL